MASLFIIQGDKSIHPLLRKLPGLLFIALITVGFLQLAALPSVAHLGLGSLTLAMVGGALLGNTLYPRLQRYCDEGVNWSKHHLLRLGIVLYGFRLSLQHIAALGISGLVIDALVLTSTFLLACYLGKTLLGLDEKTVYLIGAGSSICGAAAVLATAPTVKAEGDSVAIAVATVVIFGTIAMFLYPCLYALAVTGDYLPISPQIFGVYIGSTVHEVAQVVAAGHSISPEVENTAVIGKMLRVMLLAPFLMVLGACLQRRTNSSETEKTPMAFPWFAVGFIAVAGFNSLHWLPDTWLTTLNQIDNLLLAMAMGALGVTTRLSAVRRAGVKPLLLALVLFIWLIVGGAGINLGVTALLA